MSLIAETQQDLQEIVELFSEAERAIKEVEDIGGELIVPAVNQLRYTGNHLVRYLADLQNTDELADAKKHCKRATYDAYEAAILYHLSLYQKFKDDYRKTIINSIIPDYSDICLQIEEARRFARKNSENKTRGEFYLDGKKHWETIAKNVQKLDANREELNKQFKVDRRKFWFSMAGVIGVLIAAATLLWRYSQSC